MTSTDTSFFSEGYPKSLDQDFHCNIICLLVNHEELPIRLLADTCNTCNIMLEVYTLVSFIKTDDSKTMTASTTSGKFTINKTCLVKFLLPKLNLSIFSPLVFHVEHGMKRLFSPSKLLFLC
jgi:hypothetical protein